MVWEFPHSVRLVQNTYRFKHEDGSIQHPSALLELRNTAGHLKFFGITSPIHYNPIMQAVSTGLVVISGHCDDANERRMKVKACAIWISTSHAVVWVATQKRKCNLFVLLLFPTTYPDAILPRWFYRYKLMPLKPSCEQPNLWLINCDDLFLHNRK